MDLPPLAEFVPRFRVLFLDLEGTAPEELAASRHPFGSVLRALRERHARADVFEFALLEAMGL